MYPPRKTRRSGAPAKGHKWAESTSGKIPNPAVVPVGKRPARLKPMRTVSSGVNPWGAPTRIVKRRNRG